MRIELNGAVTEVADGTTLLALIEAFAGNARGSAVVVDGVVVPRTQWPAYRIGAAQRVELITAVQGG